jgi:hypothetical protein
MTWTGGVSTSSVLSGEHKVNVDGVNVDRDRNATVLYTPRYGSSTRTNPYGNEVVLHAVRPAGPLRLGQRTIVRLDRLRRGGGDTPIPRDGAVLSAHGADAPNLARLFERAAGSDVDLLISSTADVSETVGGTPILLRDGRQWFANRKSSFYRARAPRTIVGWTKHGELLLVTIDGRQPGYSVGASLAEAARIMGKLGAVEALNLDGGGSTTFVARGRVTNRPSDLVVKRKGRRMVVRAHRSGDVVLGRAERSVADALVLVPLDTVPTATLERAPSAPKPSSLQLVLVIAGLLAAAATAVHVRRLRSNI